LDNFFARYSSAKLGAAISISPSDLFSKGFENTFGSTSKSEEEPDLDNESENEWLTYCSLRFDGCLYAQTHGLEVGFDFCEEFMRDASLEGDPQYLMTAMYMLQRPDPPWHVLEA
jgi:hypothetical protein